MTTHIVEALAIPCFEVSSHVKNIPIATYLAAALYVMQTGNEAIWKPQGPRAVLISFLILLCPCIIVDVSYKSFNQTFPFDVVFLYVLMRLAILRSSPRWEQPFSNINTKLCHVLPVS